MQTNYQSDTKISPSVLTLRIPQSLKNAIITRSRNEGVSLNQYALYVLARDAGLNNWNSIDQYSSGKSKEKLKLEISKILNSIEPQKNIPEWDKM